MKPRLRYVLLPAALVASGIITAGASVLSLNGSDRTPYENEFLAFCYSDIAVKAPLSSTNGGKDFKVHELVVSGNFQGCEGHTMLLTALLKSKGLSYAFHEIKPNETSFTLAFASGKKPGDWHSKKPKVIDGRLFSQGASTPPELILDVGDITWVVSNTW